VTDQRQKRSRNAWWVRLSVFLFVMCSCVGRAEPGRDWTVATPAAPWARRAGHTAVVYGGKMWIIGGGGAGSGYDVWYSTNGTNWTRTISWRRPADREFHTSVVFGGKMWIVGGAVGGGAAR